MMAKGNQGGRPSNYTADLAAEICNRMACGQSLRQVCQAADMPHRATVTRWLADRPEFAAQYALARVELADYHFDEIIALADTAEDPAKVRLQIDARKWVASKLAPKKYGDRQQHELTGRDGGPIQTEDVTARDKLEAFLNTMRDRTEAS